MNKQGENLGYLVPPRSIVAISQGNEEQAQSLNLVLYEAVAELFETVAALQERIAKLEGGTSK